MRTKAKVDANQKEITMALRGIGASVTPTHQLGSGFPDLCVGFQGRNLLLEVKDGEKPPSARKLTQDEQEWHDSWRGQVCIVNSVDDALVAIGVKSRDLVDIPLVGVIR